MQLSVIVPTHNPHAGRLRRTLKALRTQTLPADQWECLLVDNASAPRLELSDWSPDGPANRRLVAEPETGLSHARRRGFLSSSRDIVVLVDDDNELAPDYLAETLRLFSTHPEIGAIGGRSLPEFEKTPAPWVREFEAHIACRDLGDAPQLSTGATDPVSTRMEYPACAPIGAGMALRRSAAQSWLERNSHGALTDRRGNELSSGGDNDMVFCILRAGWKVGYFPTLKLKHLIPANRLEAAYLARLNRGIHKSWMQVLTFHDANPWPPIPAWTVPLRQMKAWFTYRAWSNPAAFVRWQGACGHFEGRTRTR